jgi:hypothetical protein
MREEDYILRQEIRAKGVARMTSNWPYCLKVLPPLILLHCELAFSTYKASGTHSSYVLPSEKSAISLWKDPLDIMNHLYLDAFNILFSLYFT